MARRHGENVYGRRWGRGVRPYLLVPKLIGVATYVGGLASVLVLVLVVAPPSGPAAWTEHAELIHRAFARVILPGLFCALAAGVLLARPHLGAFIRMRWFQCKLAVLAVSVPVLHLFMRSRSLALAEAVRRGDPTTAEALRAQLLWGASAALICAVAVVILGRVKPRLGQNYARTFSRCVP